MSATGWLGNILLWAVLSLGLALAQAASEAPDGGTAPPAALPAGDAPANADEAIAREGDPSQASPAALLAGLAGHPALEAAQAVVRAAERDLRGVSSPMALEASYGATHLQAELPEAAPPDTPDPSGWEDQLSLDLRARPFLYGDLADLAGQRRVELERARLELRRTRAQLEAAALESAAALLLAERGVATAERALAVARRGLDATRLRAERGSADPHELERAELAVLRAEAGLDDARHRREDTARTLQDLVGERRLAALPDLPPLRDAVAPGVRQAELDLELARIGRGGAQRALYPTASASYRWPAGDGEVSLSLESQTLQPTLGYQHPSGFDEVGGFDQIPEAARPDVTGSFTVGVSVTITPERFDALEAARERVDAATQGLRAARRTADADARQRDTARTAAARSEELAVRERDLARRELASTQRRLDLGLETPLATARAELAVAEAEVAVLEARLETLRRILQSYRDTATPPSEVLP